MSCGSRAAHPMPELVFTAKGLTKLYTTGEVQVLALQGVDLEISKGEVVVLLGPVGKRNELSGYRLARVRDV